MRTIIVLAILAAGVAYGGEITDRVPSHRKAVEMTEAAMLATNATYMTPAQLKAEWDTANNDTKKLVVLGKWIASEDAKGKTKKAAKAKVKADKVKAAK